MRTVIRPFWDAWRQDPQAWALRCVERLEKGDHDFWAVAALLGLQATVIHSLSSLTLMAIREVDAFDGTMHIATMARHDRPNNLWAPVLELGWNCKTNEIVDAARWRAVLSKDGDVRRDLAKGFEGTGTQLLRATLPTGAWRMMSMEFVLASSALIDVEKSALAQPAKKSKR